MKFPDPDGKAIYFNSLHTETAVDDELMVLKDFKLWRKAEKTQKTDWNGT